MTTEFAIEKNVPIPTKAHACKYPLEGMDVGDSFFIPGVGHKEKERIYANAYNYGVRQGKKFSVRVVEGGARCWRTA